MIVRAANRMEGQLEKFALGPNLLGVPGGGFCYITKKIEIL